MHLRRYVTAIFFMATIVIAQEASAITGNATIENYNSIGQRIGGQSQAIVNASSCSYPDSCQFPSSIAWGARATAFLTSSNQVYASIEYRAAAGYRFGQPACGWIVNIHRNLTTGLYSGTISTYSRTGVLSNGSSYSPICQWLNFTVNSSSGDWNVTLRWAN